jgi:hypothetical protein
MKHKNKIIAFAVLPVLGLSLLGAATASAHGFGFGGTMNATPDEITTRQTEMFTRQAELLGVSVDVVKQGWAEGKTPAEIASANGVTAAQLQEKMKAAHAAEMQTHLKALVDKGVITQAQADARVKAMETRTANGPMKMGGGRMGRGF